ncbi:hypothetical protein OC846_003103 [Tilletia horrida]|uniref:U1-type domain-containing protein n=1 Tax=Tilletia horrida TaxID=155126 RepID=A0AAN6JY97_9BASI|nr:hypothetical protein OC845_002001 [Tilletia horrida]KAK0551922.1 hypothetical protein OC846_003103 [Tilletia horrida]KAK0568659.1 hypothetical protein OC861_001736 [Tilletia horrida]
MVNRWTCKYCNLTINDDAPSRAAHEGGFRHKAAVERALRQTYKRAERDRRDAATQAKELAKIERAAGKAAAGQGLESSAEDADEATGSKRRRKEDGEGDDKSKKAPAEWKPSNKFTAYTTAANLGIGEDEEEVRAREEQKLRQEQGFASEWSVVQEAESSSTALPTDQQAKKSSAVQLPPVEDEDDHRSYKAKEKVLPRNTDADDEPAPPIAGASSNSASAPAEGGDSGVVFRKRKAGAGAGAKKVRSLA